MCKQVAGYFEHNDKLTKAFSFHSMFLGLSPFDALAMYSLITYADLALGMWFPMSGIYSIIEDMLRLGKQMAVEVCTNSPVEEIFIENGKVTGVRLASGDVLPTDQVVSNADLPYTYRTLIPAPYRGSFSDGKLEKMDYACSGFILYLGVDKTYPHARHQALYFSEDYRDVQLPSSPLCMVAWLSLGLAAAPALAAPDAPPLAPEVAEVRDCAERNLPQRSARQRVVLERSVSGADTRRLEATLLWKQDDAGLSRVRVTVDAPQQERGTAVLLIEREGEDDMFSYLPEYRKVRRITSRAVTGSFLGTDLSYEDFQQLQGLADGARIARLPDAEIGGRPVYVLEGTPAEGAGSAYERVRSYIDRETCVLLRAELTGQDVAREVEVAWADVERVGKRWIPQRLTPLRPQEGQRDAALDREDRVGRRRGGI